MDLNKLENDINQKRKSKNLWLALSLGSFIVVVFFVTIAKLPMETPSKVLIIF